VEPRQHKQVEPISSRPDLPPSYGILQSTKGSGLLSWSFVTERMERARNYWVGTTRSDAAPHVAPVWGIWSDGAFYFATDRRSRKGRNLALDPRVAVHLESGDEVVILEGVAEEVTALSALNQFADAYALKYQVRVEVTPGDLLTNAIFVVRTLVAFAWLESDYPGGATRWRFQG